MHEMPSEEDPGMQGHEPQKTGLDFLIAECFQFLNAGSLIGHGSCLVGSMLGFLPYACFTNDGIDGKLGRLADLRSWVVVASVNEGVDRVESTETSPLVPGLPLKRRFFRVQLMNAFDSNTAEEADCLFTHFWVIGNNEVFEVAGYLEGGAHRIPS
jgi:hypothetical protein